MKKIMKSFSFALILGLVLMLGACSNSSQKNHSDKSLYAHGLEVISLMEEMAENEGYIDLYSNEPSLKEILSVVKEGNFTQPKAVYKISVSNEIFSRLTELEHMDNLSAPLKKYIKSRASAVVVNQINEFGGALPLAAANICTAEKTFVSKELTEDTLIYLYTYENAVPAVVAFSAGEDNAVSAFGCFILYEDFHTETPQEIEKFFKELSAEVELVEQ